MAALVCEICGGKLIGKPGGIFECDSCGMEYSTEWAKAKIQEIKGTVKVEGTVEVQGTVKVDGPIKVEGAANARSLLKRGQMALEDGEFEEAETYFNRVLDRDPKCGAAYWGLALADACGDIERLAKYCLEQETTEIKRARKFADDETRALLAKLDKTKPQVKQRLKEEKEAYERMLEEDRLAYAAARQRPELAKNLIAAGDNHTVGLKSDGSVVAVGAKTCGKCKVSYWTDIVAVSAGHHTVGLRTDGTVVAVGINDQGQCAVYDWTDITAVSAGCEHTVGLRSNGTVIATKFKENKIHKHLGQCDVSEWTDIVAVSAGYSHTVGLKSDGTVVAVGSNDQGECNVSDWTDIVAISAGLWHTVGLKSDGTVVATKFRESTYIRHHGQCDVSGWKLFNSIDTLEQEIAEEKVAARRTRIDRLNSEKAAARNQLSNLNGLFSGRRRNELEAKLAEIEKELKTLQ